MKIVNVLDRVATQVKFFQINKLFKVDDISTCYPTDVVVPYFEYSS